MKVRKKLNEGFKELFLGKTQEDGSIQFEGK